MSGLITLRRQIGSIRGTRQITKAMELVSASKLRRAQDYARATRDYRVAAYDLLAYFSRVRELSHQPLFEKRTVQARLYVVVTSNTGLAGAYNANVLKLLTSLGLRDKAEHIRSHVVTIGGRGAQFVRRTAGLELLAHYPAFGDHPIQADIQPLLRTMVEAYTSRLVDEVVVLYTLSRSSIRQEALSVPLLPATLPSDETTVSQGTIINFEPDAETVVEHVATRLIELELWQMTLESLASEHAMRMLAMKNATDNATELIADYTLEYNTARQAAITQQLAEITGGAEAMRDEE